MSVETRINDTIDEMMEAYENTLARKSNEAMRAFSHSRLLISDILAKHTDSLGKIPKEKATQVLRELAQIEGEAYRDLRVYVQSTAYVDAEKSVITFLEILIAAIGVVVLAEIISIPKDVVDAGISPAILLFYLAEMSVTDLASSLVTSMFSRKGDDGLNLYDRLRNISAALRVEVVNHARDGIRKGVPTSEIMRNIEHKVNDFKWRIKTIIQTELMYAQRNLTAKFGEFGEKFGMVAGLRITDHPHGSPTEHARHKCYVYARADEHGLGRGVYPVKTRKIRNPHPQCRSTLHFVMVDKFR